MSFNDATNQIGSISRLTNHKENQSDRNENQIAKNKNKLVQNIDEENGQQNLLINQNGKRSKTGFISDRKIASGQANRIGAFKKSIASTERSRDNTSPYKGLRDENEGQDSKINFPKEEFESPTALRHLSIQNQEAEAKQAIISLNNAEGVLAVVSKFEQNFFQTKNQINGLDIECLESDITAQILNTCFQIVHDCIQQDGGTFDKENIEGKIQQLLDKVQTSSQEYNSFKGEFFAVNEPVINKNILSFKIDKAQKYAQRQEEVLLQVPHHQETIQDQSNQLKTLKKQYQEFEQSLFKAKFQETKVVLKDTEDLIQKIQLQQDKLKQISDNANQNLMHVLAQTKEQKLKKQKIMSEIYQILKKLDLSHQELECETSLKGVYHKRHKECESFVQNQAKTDLIEMIDNSRKLQKIVDNYNKWNKMYKRLKEILEENIQSVEFELQKVVQESKKFQDQVQNEKKDEYDDIFRKIQKIQKKINDDVDDQKKRLDNFDKKIILPSASSQNIADQDMIFLKKEISRNSSFLISTKAMTQEITENSVKVRDESNQNQFAITVEDMNQLNSNYSILQKYDETDIPKIITSIDLLEGYCIKFLKSQLNEDNKKSQAQISKIKKNYEDLQKIIDQLNLKIGKIAQQICVLKEQFQNEDFERESDIFNKLEDQLDLNEKDVNGERNENPQNLGTAEENQLNQKLNSLQARKKNIIGLINKMVNQFNENNKHIKEANKNTKNEKEVGELLQNNKEIEHDCSKIEEKILLSKNFAAQISQKLELLLNPTIQNIKDQYIEKNQIIDECDENFEKVNAALKIVQDTLFENLQKLQKVMIKLNSVSPLVTPSNPEKDNSQFMKQVNEKTDRAYAIRSDLDEKSDKISQTRSFLLNLIQPLNELGERVVEKSEIEKILKELLDLLTDLQNLDKNLQPSYEQLDKLQDEVDFMLENDKANKLNAAENLFKNLEGKIEDISVAREDAIQKLNEYKSLILQVNQSEFKDDLVLIEQIKTHENEASQKEKELGELDAKWNDIKKKRNESKKLLDEIIKNTNKFNSQQIEGLISVIQEQVEKCGDLNQRYQEIEMELDEAIKQLKDLFNNSSLRRELQKDADETQNQIQDDLDALKNLLDTLPSQVESILQSLQEMKQGSEPDKEADYWEERKFIDKEIAAMNFIKNNLLQLQKLFLKKNQDLQLICLNMKSKSDLVVFKELIDNMKELQLEVQDILNTAYDTRDEISQIRKDMSDCQIPVNILKRKNEVHGFQEHLDNIKNDFKEMKSADQRFQGDSISENEIKELIQQIELKIRQFDQESKEIHKFQQFTLEAYKEQEFFGLNNHLIIKEVREFKDKIEKINERLKELQALVDDLNGKLMQQDIENASIILQKKIVNLRERLKAADKTLKKIVKCGEQMDGNTSQQEEDEFIDALKDEMPGVFKNVNINFIHIDDTEKLLKQVLETKSVDKMVFLKTEIEEVTQKVEQSEQLVIKLENEIIEWNSLRKLSRRDEELLQIDELAKEFKEELSFEDSQMNKEYQRISEKDNDQMPDLESVRQGLKRYLSEIEDLQKSVNDLIQERDQCFQEFDSEVPKSVKDERQRKIASDSPNGKKSTQSLKSLKPQIDNDKPTDVYYLVEINCKFKKRINELLKDLKLINQKRKDLDEKYQNLKNKLNFQPVPKALPKLAYKAVKGDAVDELFYFHLQKAGCTLNVKRLGPGKYLFGTKNIMAKIINGKLVIRVGGGYMSADEFIEQYGKMEMMKMMRQEELNQGIDNPSGQSGRQSVKLLGGASSMVDAKAMLRQSLLGNIRTYDEGARVSKDVVNIKDIESKYEMAKIGGSKSPPPRESNFKNTDTLSKTLTSYDKRQSSARLGSPRVQRK